MRGWTIGLVAALLSAMSCGEGAPEPGAMGADVPAAADVADLLDAPRMDSAVDQAACDALCAPGCGDVAACQPVPPRQGDLLIEELYYSGAEPQGGADHYFSDQFIELVNASTRVLDLSGVMVADVFGAAGAINPGMTPDSFAGSHPTEVVLSSVWRLPDGPRLAPGERLIIAHDGTNHRPFSTVDLSGAAFEAFVESSDRDDDYPTVTNLESVVFNGGYDWLLTVFGPSVVVLASDTPLGMTAGPFGDLATAPVSGVLDGVDSLMDAESADFKRLPDSVDRGFTFVAGPYTGTSLHRVQVGGAWQDTDDSGADFVAGPPNPYWSAGPAGVVDEPYLELGTGFAAFVPLGPGDDIELVQGIQGGWHVDTAVRLRGFGPEGVMLVYEAIDATGAPLSFQTHATLTSRGLLRDGDWWVRVGDRVVFDILDATPVIDTPIVLRVRAHLEGHTWTDERQVMVRAPE